MKLSLKILTLLALFVHLPTEADVEMVIEFRQSDNRAPRGDGTDGRVLWSSAVSRTDERYPLLVVSNVQVGDNLRLFSGKKCDGPAMGDYRVDTLKKYGRFYLKVRNPLPYTTKKFTWGKLKGKLKWDHYSVGKIVGNTTNCLDSAIVYGVVPPGEYDPNNPHYDPRTSRPSVQMTYRKPSGARVSLTTLLKNTTLHGVNYPLPYLGVQGIPARTPVTIYNGKNCKGEVFARGISFSKQGPTQGEMFGLSLMVNGGTYTFSAKVGPHCSTNNITFVAKEVQKVSKEALARYRADLLSGTRGKDR